MSLTYGFSAATAHKRPLLASINLQHGQRRKHSSTADHTENISHMIPKHSWGVTSWRMCKLHRHKENTAAVLLCDVTAYVEVCLSRRCLAMC
jgi:hypothetical protein